MVAKKAVKLPVGYGAKLAVKKGETYITFVARCRKAGKSMSECAKIWKAGKAGGGAKVYAKKTRRKRVARKLRRKVFPTAYGAGEKKA